MSSESLSPTVMAVAVLGVVAATFWLWSLVDLMRRPMDRWEAANQNRNLWLLVVLLGSVPGALLYWRDAKPALDRLQRFTQVEFDPTAFGVPQEGMHYDDGDGFRTSRA